MLAGAILSRSENVFPDKVAQLARVSKACFVVFLKGYGYSGSLITRYPVASCSLLCALRWEEMLGVVASFATEARCSGSAGSFLYYISIRMYATHVVVGY